MPGKNGYDSVAQTAIKRSKTVRRSSSDNIAEREDKYRSFIENLPVLFYAVDSIPPYSPFYVSPAFERFGYPIDAWLKDPDIFSKVIHPEDREWVFKQTVQSSETGKDVDYEYRIIDAKGDIHWVRDRGCLIRDRSGKVVYREGVMLDITERKFIQQELRISEERFRNIVENASDIIYVHDLEGNYLSINKAAERIIGYSREEAMKMNVRQIATPEHLERTLHQLKKKTEGVDQTSYEMDCITKDGRRLTLEINSTAIRKDGLPVGVQGIARDVTERRQAEERLRESEEFNRSIIDSSLDCIKTLDLEGNLLSLSTNGQAVMCIKNIEPFLNTSWIDFWEGADREAARSAVKSARVGKTGRFVGFFRTFDGEPKWWDVQVSPILDAAGKPTRLLAVSRDITEGKRAEDAVRESEAKFRTLAETASDAIITIDGDGIISFVNAGTVNIFGHSAASMIGQRLTMLIPERFREAHTAGLKQYIQTGKRSIPWKAVELPGLHRDGHEIQLELSFAEYDKDGHRFFTSVIRDISERKRAQEALKQSEANLAAAQRITHLGSWELEVNNVNDAKENKVRWSDEVYRIFGYKPKQFAVTSASVYAAVHPEDRAFVSEKFTEAVVENKFLDIEVRIVLPDGSERLVHARAETTYDETSGNPSKMVGTIQDITQRKRNEEALKESESRFRDLFENANDLIYTHDMKGLFTSLNRAGELITGYTREEALTKNIIDVVAPDSLKAAREMTQRKLANEDVATTYEIDIVAKGGRLVSLELSTRLIHRHGVPVGVQGIGRDITERKRTDRALKESENRYRQLGEGIFHQVWTANPDGRADYVNSRTLEYFNKTQKEMLGDGWQSVVHPDDLRECLRRWSSSLTTGELYTTEFRLRRHDGEYRWHRATATCSRDIDGKIVKWFGTNTDISDQKASEEKLNYYARHDTLTHLPNRVEFMNHLKAAIERAGDNSLARFAVLFLDLDRFKVVNDSLGHAIGDHLLIAIAERLKTCVRPGDVVARLGGDEFTILLNRTGGPDVVARVAERVQQYLAKPFKIDNYEVFTSASIGIMVSDEIMRSAEDFLRDADSAMYRAKESGKARYEIFDREMHVRNIKLLQTETDLRHAVDRNEFEVLYQPIVDLDTGAISEFEALIRWRHPIRGLVGPGEFVGVAEETGLIIDIGRWVLEESCRQIAIWQKNLPTPLSVSVNLSARQLMHPSLTKQVVHALTKTGLKAEQLKLEVTESTVMEHSEKALSILNELAALGVSISTDDFGTGYSSLSYLQRFQFNRLKIDRSFIEKMDDEKGEAIVKTILMLGENLDIEVVAEGIETNDQLIHLKRLGCRLGQGYLFARPARANDARDLIRDKFDWRYAKNNMPNVAENQIFEVTRIQ